jgi:hypothetical protein
MWVVNATPWPLYPRERPHIHCIGGRVGLDGGGKSRPHRDSIYGPFSPVASRYTDCDILSRYTFYFVVHKIFLCAQKCLCTSQKHCEGHLRHCHIHVD